MVGGCVDQASDFEGIMTSAESCILLPIPKVVHAFVAYVRIFSVSQCSQLNYKDVYLDYRRSRVVDWDDENCVGWFRCIYKKVNVLDIPAQEVKSKRRIVSDVQIKKWVGGFSLSTGLGQGRLLRKWCMLLVL